MPVPERNAQLKVHYEAGLRELDDVGAEYGVTAGRICQLAKELGWKRGGLQERIRAKAETKVASQQAVDAKAEQTAEAFVEVAATMQATIILRERADIKRSIELVEKLQVELAAEIDHAQLVRKKGAAQVFDQAKAMALEDRIDMMRKLSATQRSVFELERIVHGITPDTPVDPSARVSEAIDNGMAGLKAAFSQRLGRA